MKKILTLSLPALLLTSLCLPLPAQDEGDGTTEHSTQVLSSDNPGDASHDAQAAKTAKKAPAADKKKTAAPKKKAAKKKKKPAAPVSEYKFSSPENVATYKFDKKANPIVKEKKKPAKKKGAAKGKKGSAKPAGKPKPSKPIADEGAAPQDQNQQAQDQAGGE
jgi:hypothetical protein